MKPGAYLLFLTLPGLLSAQQFQLENLNIYGNRHTRTAVIEREMYLKSGDSIDPSDLLKERAWLLRQRLFKRVEFQLLPGSNDSTRNVIIIVQEHNKRSSTPILSNNDMYGWYGGFATTFRNITGNNTSLKLTIQLGGKRNLGIDWTHPWFGGKARLFTRIAIHHFNNPYLYNDYKPHFDLEENVVTLELGKSFGRNAKLGFRGIMAMVSFGDSDVSFSGKREEQNRTIGCFFHFDNRDLPLYPRRGFMSDLALEWTGEQSPDSYRRFTLDIRSYFPLMRQNILALQTMLVTSSGFVPIYKRLHLGGGSTVRGTPTGARSGDNYFSASLEYRFPIVYERSPLAGLHAGWAGVLFIDTGTAWFQGDTIPNQDWLLSAGCGIHVIWDSFVLRAEYGYQGTGWGFITTGASTKF